MVQKPAFSTLPGINKNFHVIQNSSPWDVRVFETFFSPLMFKHIHKETNRYETQEINKKPSIGKGAHKIKPAAVSDYKYKTVGD
jgi:hypothetical protein